MLFEQLKEIDEDILEIENFIEFRYSRKLYEVSDGEINLRKSTLHHSFTQFKARVIRLYLQQPNLFSSCSEEDDVDLDLVLDYSKEQLQKIFDDDFPKSNEYKELVLFLHDNMIESDCWR